jgi:hypothetical protein
MISLKIALTFGLAYVIICTIGCSEGYEHGWSWGITTESGERETRIYRWKKNTVRIDDIILADVIYIPPPVDKHKECRDNHYIDPYTKLEYCLPLDFENVNQLHFYRVKQQ